VAPEFGRERLVFFSDAVFAIAITLLALDIRIPELVGVVTNATLAEAIGELGPRLFAYALSFAVVGLFWLAHWRRYLLVEHVDETLVFLNLILLGFIALIPFPTAILGEHGDLAVSVVLYVVILSGAGLMGTATWLYAASRNLIAPDVPREAVLVGALRGLAIPVVFLASLALLPFGTSVVEAAWLLTFPIQALVVRSVGGRGDATEAGDAERTERPSRT
jgi:uncharacterized membrane protein